MKLRFTCLRRHLFLTLLLAFYSSSFTEATDRILTSVNPPRGNCQIDQLSPTDRRLSVSCRFSGLASYRSVLRFADQFAGVDRLSDRIFALRMKDETGANVQLEIKGDGCYVFHNPKRAPSISITYEMRLGRALDPSQSALTSSLSPEAGFLMLGDLIPRICSDEAVDCAPDPLSLQIVPPPGWTIATNERSNEGAFEIASPQRAIFFLGRLRERVLAAGPMNIRVAVAG
ncbi:MAG TPA: hypothetical protein VJ302_36100, partial [Blastocatellia bacterium]|nr:hypothetical protein [Blastocatellia bacterium]